MGYTRGVRSVTGKDLLVVGFSKDDHVLGECLLMALSGHSTDRVARSGFDRKADKPNQRMECPPAQCHKRKSAALPTFCRTAMLLCFNGWQRGVAPLNIVKGGPNA